MKSTYWTFAVTLVAVAAARAETVDITYEDGAVESGSVSLYVTNANGAKATFRTKGAFLMPGVETERASHPFDFGYWLKDSVKQFLLRFNADTVYKNDDKTVLWTYDRKMPVLAATNAFVRMELTDDNRAELHFDSGYFNFYDPTGTPTNGLLEMMYKSGTDDFREPSVYVHTGATIRAGKVCNYAVAKGKRADGSWPESRFVVDGGTFEANDGFGWVMPTQYAMSFNRDCYIDILNGGTLRIANQGTEASTFGSAWTSARFHMDIAGAGSTLDAEKATVHIGCEYNPLVEITVHDGGLLNLGNTVLVNGYAGGNPSTVTTGRIAVVRGGRFRTSGSFAMRTAVNARAEFVADHADLTFDVGTCQTEGAVFAVSNSTLRGSGVLKLENKGSPVACYIHDCTFEGLNYLQVNDRQDHELFSGNTGSIGTLQISATGGHLQDVKPRLNVTNCNLKITKQIMTGHYGDAVLTFADSTVDMVGTSNAASCVTLGCGNWPTSRVDFLSGFWRGGTNVLYNNGKSTSTSTFVINSGDSGKSGYSELNVYGGVIDWSNAGNVLYVGKVGDGRYRQTGGDVRFTQTKVVESGSADAGTTGTFELAGGRFSTYMMLVADKVGRFGTVSLTGGTLEAGCLYGGVGTSSFVSDGGLFVPTNYYSGKSSGSYLTDAIKGFTSATLGPKGLTVVVTEDDVGISQAFTGADGLFLKAGYGTLTLSGASTIGTFAAAAGKTAFTATGAAEAVIVATNGAYVAFNGGVDRTIRGLVLGNVLSYGTLELDLANTVTCATEPVFADAAIALSSAAHAAGTYDVIVFPGAASADTQAAWRRLNLGGGHQDGFSYRFQTSVTGEDEDVRTAFQIVVSTSSALGSDEYASVGGVRLWSGASEADGTRYRLSNGTYGKIEASSTATVSAELRLGGMTEVFVAEGATLTLSGAVRDGGIRKTGAGTLVLSGTNLLPLGLTVEGGVLTVADAAALGLSGDTAGGTVTLKDGTLRYDGTTPVRLPGALLLGTGSSATLELAGDWTAPRFLFGAGAVEKGGAGELTLATWTNALQTVSTEALTIREGGITFDQRSGRLSSATDFPKQQLNRPMALGTTASTGTAQPRLTVLNGGFRLTGSDTRTTYKDLSIGRGFTEGAFATHPAVVSSNCYVIVGRLLIGTDATADIYPTLIFTGANAHLQAQDRSYASEFAANDRVHLTWRQTRGRVAMGYAFTDGGAIDATFENSVLGLAINEWCMTDATLGNMVKPATWCFGAGARGRIALTGGTQLRASSVTRSAASDGGTVTQRLDGAEWIWDPPADNVSSVICWSTNDFTFLFEDSSHLRLEAGPDGFIVTPRATAVATFRQPLFGDGGFLKRGEGTLRFEYARTWPYGGAVTADADPTTLRTTGTNVVAEGTAELAAGTAAAGAKVSVAAEAALDLDGAAHVLGLTGLGTVRHGTLLRGSTIDATAPADTLTLFTDVRLRSVTVDLGDYVFTEKYPTGLVVGRASGTTAGGYCRLKGTHVGDGLCGQLSVREGYLLLDVRQRGGLTLIIR